MADAVGSPMATAITKANTNDKAGADKIIEKCRDKYQLVKKSLVDGSYDGGPLNERIKAAVGWDVEVVKRSERKGFTVQPFRWVAERTFGWPYRWRRLRSDYEFRADASKAMMDLPSSKSWLGASPGVDNQKEK